MKGRYYAKGTLHYSYYNNFFSGDFFTLYPYLYNAYTEKHHSMITDAYNYKAEIMTDEEAAAIKTSVAEFNESLANESVVLTDPFDPSVLEKSSGNDVAELLDVDEDGTISVLTVPRINIELPVRYGTSAETLARYLGLLEGSSLPIGGESTHAVITGHTGLPNTKLFTDLTELEVGDVFYLKTLKDTLAYEIDNISIVEPEDTELLKITKGQDYVTLLTCYPYGINSHRLLVRGTRVPYEEAAQKQIEMGDQTSSQWDREYFKSVVVCVIAYGAIFLAILFIRKRRSKKQR
ncbi:MAG: class C sortase [Clostridiales bacterium]|nr:class C sortase [Clostridiales bacterium]